MPSPPACTVPVVETDRLILRGHRRGDFESCAEMWADPAVTRYIGGKPSSAQQTWARLLGYVGHWSLMGFGYWVLEEKATAGVVGELGFADFQRGVAAVGKDVPELGWALASKARGRGLATEAVRAAVAWGDAHLEANRTVALIDSDNRASVRVAEKCGYEVSDSLTLNARPTLLFARTATGSKERTPFRRLP